jgi:hypothetical protein
MATPNELAAALSQARHAMNVTLSATRIVDQYLVSQGVKTGQGQQYLNQEIAKIDAVLNSYYGDGE